MTATAPAPATDEAAKPYPVRTAISPDAGRALQQLQLNRGLTYNGRKWPLAAICAELLEQALLPK